MSASNKIILKIITDFIIVCLIGIPILLIYLIGEPYRRGFFCDDLSIKLPFHESTVSNPALYLIGILIPTVIIIITETVQAKFNTERPPKIIKIGNWNVPAWLSNSYQQIGYFAFGAACSQLTTDVAKYTIGRLRPHFIDVCQPIINGGDCSNPANMGRYIEEYACSGTASDFMMRETRLSFPSGHSSFSAYTLIYTALFLHARMTCSRLNLFKCLIQFGLILLVWFIGLSRIPDNKHHWSDVLVGFTIGVFCAMIVASFVSKFFKTKNVKEGAYELSTGVIQQT